MATYTQEERNAFVTARDEYAKLLTRFEKIEASAKADVADIRAKIDEINLKLKVAADDDYYCNYLS